MSETSSADTNPGDRPRTMGRSRGPITILLVDRHVSVLRGLRMRLELEADFRVVGEASSLPQAGELLDQLQPDVVLLDASLMRGFTSNELRAFRTISPRTGLVLHVLHTLEPRKRRILEKASDLALVKQDTGEALPNAIRDLIIEVRASGDRSA